MPEAVSDNVISSTQTRVVSTWSSVVRSEDREEIVNL